MLAFKVESWIWYGIVLFVAVSRFVSRRMALGSFAKFEADEYVMCAILCFFTVLIATVNIVESTSSNLLPPGYDVENMTQADLDERTLGSKLILVVENCQMLVIWGTKVCLLIMYFRFTTLMRESVAIKIIAAYVAISYVVMEILYMGVWCRPFHNYWAVPTPNAQCNTAINHLITNAVFNISSDVFMLLLGVPMFLRIQIPLTKKVPLVGIFSLGIFVIIAAVLNKYYSFTAPFDNAWVYWYVRESATAIIVANLPFVWLLYRKIFGIRTTSVTGSRSRTKSGQNAISLRSRTESKVPTRTPRGRRGSDDSDLAFELGKSYHEMTTTITAGDKGLEKGFDDGTTRDSSPGNESGLSQGQIHVSRETNVSRVQCPETATIHDKKSAGSFLSCMLSDPIGLYSMQGSLGLCVGAALLSAAPHLSLMRKAMIEPISAFALAGNVLQFIELGYKTYHVLHQLRTKSETDENSEIQQVAHDMAGMCTKLGDRGASSNISTDEKELQKLASTCKKKAEKLKDVLEKLVVRRGLNGAKQHVEAMRKTLETLWRQREIKDLQKEMAALREQLSARMIYILSDRQSGVFTKLEDISSSYQRQVTTTAAALSQARGQMHDVFEHQREHARTTAQSLQTMGKALQAIEGSQQSIQAVLQSQRKLQLALESKKKMQDALEKLRFLSERAALTETTTQILKSLRFEFMQERQSLIKERHAKTFSWVFEADATPFRAWLEDGNGAFWISGRAGSGKSTLMKFLETSPETKDILLRWAGKRQLFVTSFYFWITASSSMQKSQEGLLQSIIFEILRQEPALIPKVTPERWGKGTLFHLEPIPWSLTELYGVLEAIIREKPKACFCIFIDGLDEYVGNAWEHGEFARKIQQLGQSTAVKLCVASRPWIAFSDVFGNDKQHMLMMEHLTRDDMDAYVRDMLQENRHFRALIEHDDRANELIHEIRDRAHGVFLWVTLVVGSLLSGLTQKDGFDELKIRLDELPPTLKGFFERMLESTDDSYKPYAARVLSLAQCSTPLPLMAFWWVGLEAEDPDYAIDMRIESLEKKEVLKETARSRLNKWTRDMLIAYRSEEGPIDYDDLASFKIDFLHRTVGEFLREPEIYEKLRAEIKSEFNANLSWCRLLLAEAKTRPMPRNSRARDRFDHEYSRSSQAVASQVMYHAKQYEQQTHQPLMNILQSLDSVMTSRLEDHASAHWTSLYRVSHPSKVATHRSEISNSTSNFLAYAVGNNLLKYVEGTLRGSSDAIQKSGRPLLDFAIYPTFAQDESSRGREKIAYRGEMIKLLLEHGASPNDHSGVKGVMTVWQMFLLDTWTSGHREKETREGSGAWEVAKMLLKHNANREARIPVGRATHDLSISSVKTSRTIIQEATVTDCLSRIESIEGVEEFLSSLPRKSPGGLGGWMSWFS
ncbi:hypothetical protein Q7P37_001146 [Cladosporium fusiforme]